MNPVHYFKGEFVEKERIHISVDNVGFLRGYGVFEFFKAHGKQPLFMEDHLDRLFRSAKGMNMAVPLSKQEIAGLVNELLRRNGFAYSSVKILLTGGDSVDGFTPGEPEIIILNNPFVDGSDKLYEDGASLMLYKYQRDFPTIKSLYYATTVALQSEWKSKGHIDVLYHNGEEISEVSRSNVFVFKNGVLKTNEDGVLGGITRMHALRAASNNFKVEIGAISLSELLEADEVFITSTTKKVLPIIRLDEQLIGDGKPGVQTKKMIEIFDQYIEDYLKA
ncbi:MAG: aminotransferase class IV family protein [Roseivirga sp.]|jgi:branched-subunit amino acid aminotransferase/4-amino-4-deoxychorismate lyase|uniref:aminotransferase class IV n=1 Tax=Roseivirga sp. TaxID=1964215 RepID=UPI001B1B4283|nr:aminotransferase class IV [Roseivirga sp.]MBO6497344.1 aminotransferase class IV family protein [Roseivirga sp.]